MLRKLALLDVDQTLILNLTSNAELNSFDDLSTIKESIKKHLNVNLLSALFASDVRDVYLFTNMSFKKPELLERFALTTILEEYGFTVHGVVSPTDVAWHLSLDKIKSFIHSQESELKDVKDYPSKKRELMENADINPLLTISDQDPGQAFRDGIAALRKNTYESEKIGEKGSNSELLVGFNTRLNQLHDTKGKMMEYFLSFLKKATHPSYNQLIVCDDQDHVLKSIQHAHAHSEMPLPLTLVKIPKTDAALKEGKLYQHEINSLEHTQITLLNKMDTQIVTLLDRSNDRFLMDKKTIIEKSNLLKEISKKFINLNLKNKENVYKLLSDTSSLLDNQDINRFQYGKIGKFFASIKQRDSASMQTKTETRLLLEELTTFLINQLGEGEYSFLRYCKSKKKGK